MKSYQILGLKAGLVLFGIGYGFCFWGTRIDGTTMGFFVGIPMLMVGLALCVAAPVTGWAIAHEGKVAEMSGGGFGNVYGGSGAPGGGGNFGAILLMVAALTAKLKIVLRDAVAGLQRDLLRFRDGGLPFFKQALASLWGRLKASSSPVATIPWRDQYPVVILALIFCWPVGLFLLWRTRRLDRADKILLSGATLLWILAVTVL